MSQRFSGRVAFITGGATGIGCAFAHAIIAEGGAAALADIDVAAAESAATELRAEGGKAIAVACDVADELGVQRAVDEVVGQLGGIDILLNNAGRHMKKYNQGFSKLTHDEIRGLFDVNVMGIVNCSLACRDSMKERGGGAIVNMSSLAGYMVASAYGVSKLAVRGLAIAFAHDFADDNIRVNAVAPGLTPTENVLAEYSDEHFETSAATHQLIHRRATVDDVLNTVLFLCSDEASFVTGETIRVGGGRGLSI